MFYRVSNNLHFIVEFYRIVMPYNPERNMDYKFDCKILKEITNFMTIGKTWVKETLRYFLLLIYRSLIIENIFGYEFSYVLGIKRS